MQIVTVDLGGSRFKAGLVQDGDLLSSRSTDVDATSPFRDTLDDLDRLLRSTCEDAGVSLSDCDGLGVSCPGTVDRSSNSVVSTNDKHDDIKEMDLTAWARDEYNLSLNIENDARSALLGEWFHGAGQGTDHLVVVTLGTGFGSAVVMNGHLLTGVHHRAGILGGHLVVRSDGYPCNCGRRGCLETEVGEWNLPNIIENDPDLHESDLDPRDDLNYKTLIETASAGDRVANDILRQRLNFVSIGLNNLIHAYDPERIVLGGGVMNNADRIMPDLRSSLTENRWIEGDTIELLPADYPDTASLFGVYTLFERNIPTI